MLPAAVQGFLQRWKGIHFALRAVIDVIVILAATELLVFLAQARGSLAFESAPQWFYMAALLLALALFYEFLQEKKYGKAVKE